MSPWFDLLFSQRVMSQMCSPIITVNSVDKNYHFLTVLKYSTQEWEPILHFLQPLTTQTHSTSQCRTDVLAETGQAGHCARSRSLSGLSTLDTLAQPSFVSVWTPVVHSTPPGPWREVFLPSDSWPPNRLIQATRTWSRLRRSNSVLFPICTGCQLLQGVDTLSNGCRGGGEVETVATLKTTTGAGCTAVKSIVITSMDKMSNFLGPPHIEPTLFINFVMSTSIYVHLCLCPSRRWPSDFYLFPLFLLDIIISYHLFDMS